METINEFSRFDQLVGNGHEIVATAMADYSVDFYAVVDEIEATLSNSVIGFNNPDALWYLHANAFAHQLANKYNTTFTVAAGIISAVSPRMPWLRNKRVAESILIGFKEYDYLPALDAAKAMGLGMSANVAMAIKIARGESISDTLTGTKRRSFYNNIVEPLTGIDSVTVDTWMLNAFVTSCGITKKDAENFARANYRALGGTGAGYYVMAEAVRMVAQAHDVPANFVQAAYWCQVAGSADGGRSDIN